jgi:O-antigen biosynthesis protein
VVATDLLAKQLGWTHKAQLLSANPEKNDFAEKVIELYQNRELWESIKKNALQVLKKDMSYSDYKQNVADILTSVLIH